MDIHYHSLTFDQFQDAISGIYQGASRWMMSPKLYYYYGATTRVKDRHFLIATIDAQEDGEKLQQPVGMIELQQSPDDASRMWMLYITVHPDFQRQGISKKLVNMLASHMLGLPGKVLSRSTSSDEAVTKNFAKVVDEILDAHDVLWEQNMIMSYDEKRKCKKLCTA